MKGGKNLWNTYARKKLIQISGRSKIGGYNSLEWLLKLMFDPQAIDTLECFRIFNNETVDALGIGGPYKRRYSYSELYSSIRKCQEIVFSVSKNKNAELLPYEREMVKLWNNINEFAALSSAFSVFYPSEDFTIYDSALASQLQLVVNRPYSFADLIGASQRLSQQLKQIRNIDSLKSDETELVQLVRAMHTMGSQMENTPPCIIPIGDSDNEAWYSLWGYLNKSGYSALTDDLVRALQKLWAAYLAKDSKQFNEAAQKLTATSYTDFPHPELEVLYNNLNLFLWAKIVFILAAIMTIFCLFYNQKLVNTGAFIFIIAGLLLQTAGLILRIVILMRPPLASLYETFLFVSWIIVLLGTGLEIIQRRNTGKLIASCGGLLLLILSDRYVVQGDTFGVIVAVLNSNFWLTIHIVTIATGYAAFFISGLLGHVYLIQRATGTANKTARITLQTVSLFLILGLAFTVAGTVLGGMWADQAWGRFWGWDPKENGALVLVLWGTAVIHARKTNLIGPKMTAAGAIMSIPLIMLTWIGVNLLGVGLHSYGFTYSGARLLAAVFVLETLFLVIMGSLHIFKNQSVPVQ